MMRKHKRGFTLIELLVVIAIIAVLMAILMPALNRVKEQGKRIVCESSLKNLQLCWLMYADDNDGKIVNGAGGIHYNNSGAQVSATDPSVVERAWVDVGWGDNWDQPNAATVGTLSDREKKLAIEQGALWEYTKDYGVYKCPTGRRGECVTYSVVDSMNGLYRAGTTSSTTGGHPHAVGARVGPTVLWIKRRSEISSPTPAQRMVYIDEGAMTPDSFATNYNANTNQWWDDPPVRHGDGTTVSWADGHVSHLKWKAAETIDRARDTRDYYGGGGWTPSTPEGLEELHLFQKYVWGRNGF
jgi:prepilin-type N-terminal cleavage/methylation domain-containing protein/prepilin-type processing-associated H-X9-DG protein